MIHGGARSAVAVASALALACAVPRAGRRPAPAAVDVQLLAINDFHGNLEPPEGSDGLVGDVPAGGVEYLATHLKQAVADHPDSIVVGAGDLIGASPLISGLFHDDPTVEALDALGFGITSVGNHEFDRGPANLLRVQREAHFQYLAANVVTAGTSPPATLLPATAVRTIAGVKVGFIGDVLAGAAQLVSPAALAGVQFLDEAEAANRSADALERQGVHAIVLLIHQGGRQHPPGAAIDPNACENFTGPIETVVSRLSPAIKVIVSGHTHQFYNCRFGDRAVTSAGSYGRLFTRISISINPATDTITRVTARNEIVTRTVPKDPAETAIIDKYQRLSAPLAQATVGSISAGLVRHPNAAGESALGDVIADAQLAATAGADAGGAVVAFMNPGGIRADLQAADGGRDVAYGELYSVQPFGNTLTVLTMTGDMLRRLLEEQFDRPGTPVVLQVSRGFTYRYRPNAPAGQHVDPDSIAIDGHAVAPDDAVRVEASDFLVAGGDGFRVFGEGTDRVGGSLDVDALVEYFKRHSPVAPGPQDRIVRVE